MIGTQSNARTSSERRDASRLAPAAVVAGAYALAGTAWILLSEWLLNTVTPEDQAVLAQVIKGVGFVVVTGLALYVVLGRLVGELQRSERAQATLAAEVRIRAREQRRLAHRLMQAEEETRRAVAKDLHDGPLQTLTLTFMQLDAAGRMVEDGQPVDAESITRAMDAIREASDEIRGVVRALHPPLLAELGLAPAVERHCRESALRAGRDVRFQSNGAVPTLRSQSSIAVFRILQEALANALKHTEQGHITVELHVDDGAVRLSVTDLGPGFTPEAKVGAGLGLLSMRERAESVGAEYELRTSPRTGTSVTVRVPADLGA